MAVDCPGLRPGAGGLHDQPGRAIPERDQGGSRRWRVDRLWRRSVEHAPCRDRSDQRRERQGPASQVDVSDRRPRPVQTTPIVEDGDVHHDALQPRVRDRRPHRPACGTTSTSSAPPSSAAARTTAAWRSPTTRSSWRPRCQLIALDKKPARWSGRPRSLIPSSATPRPCADGVPGQGHPGHLGRRVRHPRFHQRLQQGYRRAGLALDTIPGPDEVQPTAPRAGTACSPRRLMASIP